jgi:uncharacterized FlaG/YvyC family protein
MTKGAIKQIKNVNVKVPKYGTNVKIPSIPPNKMLNTEICLNKIKSILVE